jgi:hypothetical protein
MQSSLSFAITVAVVTVGCGGSVSQQAQADGGPSGDDAGIAVDTGVVMTPKDSGAPVKDSGTAMEASVDTGVDTGGPSIVYPAFPIDVPQVTNNGGTTLAAPVIVTVTWSSDPNAATWNAFGDAIGGSSYWHAINSEYGVGPATSGTTNHVSITTAAPATLADTDVANLVAMSAGVAPWPANTPNTIYAIYLAPTTSFTYMGADVCTSGIGGYHQQTTTGVVYAVLPQCSFDQPADIELSASHELDEAATDPHIQGALAYAGFDQNHIAMEFFNKFQDELGDACEFFATAADSTDLPPYTVQRQWSNASAAAGHDWCVPSADGYMYNTTLLPSSNTDTISPIMEVLGYPSNLSRTKGFKVALNASRTFPVGLFSDQALSGPFTLSVQGGQGERLTHDLQGNTINNGSANITLDRTSGVNGGVAMVTVTPTAFNSLGIVYFRIKSTLPNAQQSHYLPILISQN